MEQVRVVEAQADGPGFLGERLEDRARRFGVAPPIFVSGNLVIDERVGLPLHDFENAGVFLVEHKHARFFDVVGGIHMSGGALLDSDCAIGLVGIGNGLNGASLADQ